MAKVKLADYLFKRISDAGVETTFGIPGDFILPFYAAQERFGLKTAVMTHEPSVGYAADGYARLKGLGVALVTYGAGGLNMVNPVGLAYAEESPVLVISGGPETRFRQQKPQLHHCVKSFETQRNVFAEVTEAQTILTDPSSAQVEVDRVVDTVLKVSRPGYIEIPRDMVNHEIITSEKAPPSVEGTAQALEEALAEILHRLNSAERPVLFVGAQTRRFKLVDKVVALAESLNIPVVTAILGKASFPETHQNFIGTYFGQFANPGVREYVESSDCIFCLGVVLTEMETGGYTAKLDPARLIQATASEVTVGYHSYTGLDLSTLVAELSARTASKLTPTKRFTIPKIDPEDTSAAKERKELTVLAMIEELNQFISERHIVVSDVGDCLYAGLSLKTNAFIAPGYYSSMGFGVPAAIGAQLADKNRRPIVLVGDGGFQMTGMEISTAVKLGLNPIVIVFNNATYAMLRFVDQQREYYKLPRWDYVTIARAVGAQGAQAFTRSDFQSALKEAEKSNELYLIDAMLPEEDISPTLKRLTDHFGKKVKAAIS
jgi:indolepyruvate decarboxylase